MQDTAEMRAWIAELRSTDKKQGQHFLCSRVDLEQPLGYCCLGILADMHDMLVEKSPEDGMYRKIVQTSSGDFPSTLPEGDIVKFGMSPSDQRLCYQMNDGNHWDFNEIAQVLEDALDVFHGDLEAAYDHHYKKDAGSARH